VSIPASCAGLGDPFRGLAQLRAAVAPLAAEDVPGQALTVRPDQRRAAAGRGLGQRPFPVAEPERDVLLAVHQAVEGEYTRGGAEAVAEPHRDSDPAPDRGRREHRGHRV
jgi:hypothetical protein